MGRTSTQYLTGMVVSGSIPTKNLLLYIFFVLKDELLILLLKARRTLGKY